MSRFDREDVGAVLVEVAIAVPVFIMLFIFSSEYVRAMQAQHSMAVLTREAANAAFRDCIELDEMDECLDYVYDNMTSSISVILPGAKLLISVYTYEEDRASGAVTIQRKEVRGDVDGLAAAGRSSRFTEDLYRGERRNFIQLHQKLAIAEIFYDFTPLFQQTLISREFYDAAIY